MNPIDSVGAALPKEVALRQACTQLEGLFLEQLMKSMRATIPEGGVIDGGVGEDVFSSLFDEHIARTAAERIDGSLADALYRQLRGGLGSGRDGQ